VNFLEKLFFRFQCSPLF